jgi:hypothetical protein
MEGSIGRATEPTTEAGGPDAREIAALEFDAPELHTPEFDADVRRRVRDLPPSMMREDTGIEDTGIIDLDELQRSIDPLDARRPGRPTGDPLDPDGGMN